MKKKTKTTKSKSKSAAKPATKSARKSRAAAKKSTAKATPRSKVKARPKAKPSRHAKTKTKAKAKAKKQTARDTTRWVRFVEQHGVVLASARGPVPSVAEAIAGEPIVGSWWSHPKAQAIFDALSTIDDSADIRCFKLVDGKITFVHRRAWPALARLAEANVIPPERVASIVQEHMPTGEHRNHTTPYPDWVPDEVAAAAAQLSLDEAKQQLGSWVP